MTSIGVLIDIVLGLVLAGGFTLLFGLLLLAAHRSER